MASWDEVEVGFGGEETVRFGPRFEPGTALYQLETRATISASGKVTEPPRVLSHADSEAVFVCVNHQLSIFTDNCRRYLATLEFTSGVSALGSSEDGRFLAVGEHSGMIHLFNRKECLKLLSFVVEEPVAGDPRSIFLDVLLKCDMSEKSQLMVLTGFNRIHIFGLDMKNLHEPETLKCQDQTHLTLSHMTIDTSQVHDSCVNSMLLLPSSFSIITSGSGQSGHLCLWKKKDERFCPHLTEVHSWNDPIVKCAATLCEAYLVVLDQGQYLSLWSIDHLVIIWASKMPHVQDFSIVNKESKDQAMSVLTLSQEESTGVSRVMISTIPSMQSVYSIQLNSHVTLARCSPLLEEFYLIEGESDADNNAECISTLRVHSLIEASPEGRLQRMLHRELFVEAEEFARQFELDVQPVFKAKAKHLLDILSAEENTSRVHFEELKACFLAIDDDEYVVDCCLSTALLSLELLLDVLEHAKTRLKNKTTLNRDTHHQLMKKITEATHRLGTLQMIYGGGCLCEARWKSFQEVDLVNEMARCLQNGWISAVWLIWTRHYGSFRSRLSCVRVAKFLDLIPDETSSDELVVWLSKGLVPFAVQNLPEALPLIASWIEGRVKNMEFLEPAQWPLNALRFCESMISTFTTLSTLLNKEGLLTPKEYVALVCNLSDSHVKTKLDDDLQLSSKPFVRLLKLRNELSAICELREKFNCRLTLSDFQMETVDSLACRLLDRVVAVELVPHAICTTLRPYLKQHNLDEDKFLYQYVGDLFRRYGGVVSFVGPASWEVRAIEVIRCIKDIDYRCDALLEVMGRAYIPWSSEMEAVVDETLHFHECPRKKEIEEKHRIAELGKLLISYGRKDFNIADRDCADMLVYYILCQDRPSAMQDALQVVSFYSHLNRMIAYLYRAKFLAEAGREAEMVELVKSLPSSEAVVLTERFVRYATMVLSSIFPKTTRMIYSRAACVAIRLRLKLNSDDEFFEEAFGKLYSVIESIANLQVEFDEFLSVEEYSSQSFRKEILIRYLNNGFTKSKKDESTTDVSDDEMASQALFSLNAERKQGKSNARKCKSLHRLAELLNIHREELSFELASKAIADGKPTDAIAICKELCETSNGSEAGLVLMKVVRLLCDHFKHAENYCSEMMLKVGPEIHKLAQLALSSVPGDLLVDCLQLCRITQSMFDALNPVPY